VALYYGRDALFFLKEQNTRMMISCSTAEIGKNNTCNFRKKSGRKHIEGSLKGWKYNVCNNL
jgi:hypothetical protein